MCKLSSIAAMLLLCLLFSLQAFAAGVGSANVKFGKPNKSTADCAGKGICTLSMESGGPGSVSVDFSVIDDGDDRKLEMKISIPEMETTNHEYLYSHFLDENGMPRASYKFEAPYTFTNTRLCAEMGIEPGTVTIKPTTASSITRPSESEIIITYHIN